MPSYHELIAKIKQKPELKGISDTFVKQELENYLKKNKIDDVNEKLEKDVIKSVRAELRIYAGQFNNSTKRQALLKEEDYPELLKTHSSTKERLVDYQSLKEIISKLKPKSILDIGCGLNPIAIATSDIEYYACDINQHDLEIVDFFFKKKHIKGKVFYADARTERNFPSADLCLILKLVDLLDKKDHKTSESLITNINCKHIVISFSTKTLSGKPMNHPQRGWIEQLAKRLEYKIELVKTKNELFYIITKY